MQSDAHVLFNKKKLLATLLGYVAISLLMPAFFRLNAHDWFFYSDSALFCYGGILLRAFSRQVYRKLKQILPEHEKQIQSYRDDLPVFKWNTMVKPDFIEPLAEGYPRKAELMSELRLAYKLCRIWQFAMYAALLALFVPLIIFTV